MLEMPSGLSRIAPAQLQLAERCRRPDLEQPRANFMAEPERVGGVSPAFRLPAPPCQQPRETSKSERQVRALAAFAREVDRLAVGSLGNRPAVGGCIVSRNEVKHERQRPDRR